MHNETPSGVFFCIYIKFFLIYINSINEENIIVTKDFLFWWLVFVIQLLALSTAYFYELHTYVLQNDQTYISFALLGLWFLTSVKIGHRSYTRSTTSDETYWFIAETCMSIGMMGTVLGFILMLDGSDLGSLDPSDIQSMKDVIGQLANGMATALLTTLVGLIASVSLRSQLILQDNNNK